MRAASILTAGAVLVLAGLAKGEPPGRPPRMPAPDQALRGHDRVSLPPGSRAGQSRQLSAELTEAGRSARGVFISALNLRRRGIERVIASLKGARMTALVTDLKDERGMIVYPTEEPTLQAQRETLLANPSSIVKRLHDAGLYAVARIVCFKDGALARARPDLAARDARTGRTWRGHLGFRWTSPYSTEVQDRLIAVARDAEAMGFDEIQLDYVRFPVEDEAEHAEFPHRQEVLRRFVIARFIERLDAAVGVAISVDLYGLTPFNLGDPTGLGQSLEDLAPHVEVFSPMLYSASFDESTVATPAYGHRAAAIVSSAVLGIQRRVGHLVAIRPYLQAFPFREPEFGLSYVHAQARAAEASAADGFLFWNPRSDYRTVYQSIRALGIP